MIITIEMGNAIALALVFNENTVESQWSFLMFFPPVIMVRWSNWLLYAGFRGEVYTYDNWWDIAGGSVPLCCIYMAAWSVFYLVALWYLEQVKVNNKHPLWFAKRDEVLLDNVQSTLLEDPSVPNDVKEEAKRVMNKDNGNIKISLQGLCKAFKTAPSNTTVSDSTSKAASHHINQQGNVLMAVKELYLGVNKSECFGLLGHTGAGKTTTINMLVGNLKPTKGTALVEGLDICKDMSDIYLRMGVCPQHDVLWASLTGREHLLFYGRLKRLSGAALNTAVKDALEAVNLTFAKDRKAGKYSGGMKRRLSVACSLIGDPPVVYLDEPSTGLDPASRHQLWDVVTNAKKNKSIILTTHHLEEAEILCDRIGIMSAGELKCVDTAPALKLRFGAGYTIILSTSEKSDATAAKVETAIKKLMPSARLLDDSIGGTSKFEVIRSDVILSKVYEELESQKAELGITDWLITETTLEEVFLKISQLEEHGIKCSATQTLEDAARYFDFATNKMTKPDE